MELVVPEDESQTFLLLQACEANDLTKISTMLTANPEIIVETAPGKDLSFILFVMDSKSANIVNASLTALQNSPVLTNLLLHFLQQGGLCVSKSIRSSLDDGSCDMLEVIHRHRSLLFENETSFLEFVQIALMYSIMKGNLAPVEFILDHYPSLLDAPLSEGELNASDLQLLENLSTRVDYGEQINNPILMAAAKGHLAICKALLRRGVNAHFRNDDGTPAYELYCGTSTLFIEYGCPIQELNYCLISLFEDFDDDPMLLNAHNFDHSEDEDIHKNVFFMFRIFCKVGFDWQPRYVTEDNVLLYTILVRGCLAVLKKEKEGQQGQSAADSLLLPTTTPNNYLDILHALIDGHLSPSDNQEVEELFMEVAFDAYQAELEDPLFLILTRMSDEAFHKRNIDIFVDKKCIVSKN